MPYPKINKEWNYFDGIDCRVISGKLLTLNLKP